MRYSIIRLILQLVLSNHIIACLWFHVGDQEDPDSTWLERAELKNKPVSFQYATRCLDDGMICGSVGQVELRKPWQEGPTRVGMMFI